MSEISFNKNTTSQGRGIGIRRVNKEYEEASKNDKASSIEWYQEGDPLNAKIAHI